MPHPQTRMATALAVGRRAAPVLHEEQRQTLLRGAEVLLGVHRLEHLIAGHLAVEDLDETPEHRLAADLVVERERFAHAPGSSGVSAAGFFGARLAGGDLGPGTGGTAGASASADTSVGRLRRGFHTGRSGGVTGVGFVFGGLAPRPRCAPSTPPSLLAFN